MSDGRKRSKTYDERNREAVRGTRKDEPFCQLFSGCWSGVAKSFKAGFQVFREETYRRSGGRVGGESFVLDAADDKGV